MIPTGSMANFWWNIAALITVIAVPMYVLVYILWTGRDR